MAQDDPHVCFEPKRYGLGAGWPVAPQGWALLIGYLVLLFGLREMLAERHPLLFTALTIVLTGALLVMAVQHTRGGWRWRWGGEDER